MQSMQAVDPINGEDFPGMHKTQSELPEMLEYFPDSQCRRSVGSIEFVILYFPRAQLVQGLRKNDLCQYFPGRQLLESNYQLTWTLDLKCTQMGMLVSQFLRLALSNNSSGYIITVVNGNSIRVRGFTCWTKCLIIKFNINSTFQYTRIECQIISSFIKGPKVIISLTFKA